MGSLPNNIPSESDDEEYEDWRNYSFNNDLKVLIVGNSHLEQVVWTSILEVLCVQTTVVNNGKEAVDLFAAGDYFDLVLMDSEMPILSGVEATRTLREMGVATKIVGIAADFGEEPRQSFLDVGVDYYIVKPISPINFVIWLQDVEDDL